jgi:hypothetical protein
MRTSSDWLRITFLLIPIFGVADAANASITKSTTTADNTLTTFFTDNDDGTISDKSTGRMWQKDDDGRQRKWAVSGGYCAALKLGNHSDWRLPGMEDLVPLWENAGSKSQIRYKYFPKMKKDFYWSSSKGITFPGGQVTAYWGINFYGKGIQGQGADGNTGYVRCVRNEQPPKK